MVPESGTVLHQPRARPGAGRFVPGSRQSMPEAGKTPHDRFVEAALAAAANPTPVIEVGIPMRDGMELAADVYLPREEDRPAPAIVTMTPYDKAGMFVAPEGRFYQQNGYVYV